MSHDNCPICSLLRWNDPERKKIPQKVLRHFSLVPRLQRVFLTEGAEEAQWHKIKRKPSHKEFTLSKEQKIPFIFCLWEVKFLDGYASNISRCINFDGTNVQDLTTHDCHILLQRNVPAALSEFF